MKLIKSSAYYYGMVFQLEEEKYEEEEELFMNSKDFTGNRRAIDKCNRNYDRRIRVFKAKAWFADKIERIFKIR